MPQTRLPPLRAGIFNAFGAVLFAYSFSFILIEIADTVKDEPEKGMPVKKATKKAVYVAMALITFFYLAVGIAGYMASTCPAGGLGCLDSRQLGAALSEGAVGCLIVAVAGWTLAR
jgi:amino acid permease